MSCVGLLAVTVPAQDPLDTDAAGPIVDDTICEDLCAVAAAMLRLMVPNVASGLCLRTSWTDEGITLQAIRAADGRLAGRGVSKHQVATDLMLIDSVASRWGQCSNEDTHILWAVLAAPGINSGTRLHDEPLI